MTNEITYEMMVDEMWDGKWDDDEMVVDEKIIIYHLPSTILYKNCWKGCDQDKNWDEIDKRERKDNFPYFLFVNLPSYLHLFYHHHLSHHLLLSSHYFKYIKYDKNNVIIYHLISVSQSTILSSLLYYLMRWSRVREGVEERWDDFIIWSISWLENRDNGGEKWDGYIQSSSPPIPLLILSLNLHNKNNLFQILKEKNFSEMVLIFCSISSCLSGSHKISLRHDAIAYNPKILT